MAINVTYQVYSNGGWLPNVTNLSDYAGIYGRPIQGVYASLSSGSIRYRTHSQGGSWLPWVTDRSDYAGIIGTNVDGLQMEVVGLSGYNVRYRAYVSGSWLPWVMGSADYAGIYGQPIEAIQVEIVSSAPDYTQILNYAGNNGAFKGVGVTFPAYDVWKTISVVSLIPTVILEGKVSLQGQVNGSFIDLSLGSTNLAASFKSQLVNLGISTDATLTVNNLAATFNSITANSQLDQYAKISATATATSLTIQLQFSFKVSEITVYQIIKITISNIRTFGYVTVPIAQSNASFKMSKQDVFICFGLIAAVALVGLGASVIPLVAGYGMQAASSL